MYPLDQIDHLMMISEDGSALNCFCGAFRPEFLPVSIRTWTPLKLVYSIPHYSWSTKGFSFKSSYSFNNDALCGSKTFTTHSGKQKYTTLQITSTTKWEKKLLPMAIEPETVVVVLRLYLIALLKINITNKSFYIDNIIFILWLKHFRWTPWFGHKLFQQFIERFFVEFILSPAMHLDSWLKSWSTIIHWGK